MKNHRIIITLALAVAFAAVCGLQSCSKVAQNLKFTLSMQTQAVNITIPPTAFATGTATYGPVTNSYNVDSFIKAQTGTLLGVSNITSVKITACSITINNPDSSNNLQNFQSGYAEFSSNTNTTPYQVAIPPIADVYTTTMNLPVDSTAELKSYLGDQFNYSVTGKLRRSTTIPLNCTLTFTFSVSVQG